MRAAEPKGEVAATEPQGDRYCTIVVDPPWPMVKIERDVRPNQVAFGCAWGLDYDFTMVWHKPGGFQPFGLPQYNCEFVLFGHRGPLMFLDTAFSTS
jgi:hypothetical protein